MPTTPLWRSFAALIDQRPGMPTAGFSDYFDVTHKRAYTLLCGMEDLGIVRSEMETFSVDCLTRVDRCWYLDPDWPCEPAGRCLGGNHHGSHHS